MRSAIEVLYQRQATKMFIASDSDSVVLEPFTRTSNGSGGFTLTPSASRPPQVMRLIPVTTFEVERNTLDGKTVRPQFMLLGAFDAAVARGDKFTLRGGRYEVVHVQEDHDYQTKAETIYLGEASG